MRSRNVKAMTDGSFDTIAQEVATVRHNVFWPGNKMLLRAMHDYNCLILLEEPTFFFFLRSPEMGLTLYHFCWL